MKWKLIVLFLGIVFLINIVSSLESPFAINKIYEKEDSSSLTDFLKIDFNSEYGAIKLSKTFFWIPTDKIAEYSLTENTDYCSIDCSARGKVVLYQDGVIFDNFNFYDANNLDNQKEIAYKLYINDKIDKETGDVLWKEYKNSVLPSGNYYWKVEGTKNVREDIEWIATAFGTDFDEWTVWNDGDFMYNFTITATSPREIVSNSTHLMILDQGFERIYFYLFNGTANGNVLVSNATVNNMNGLDVDDTYFYITDASRSKIIKRLRNGTNVLNDFYYVNDSSVGIAHDSNWFYFYSTNNFSRYYLNGTFDSNLSSEGLNYYSYNLEYYDGFLYSVDLNLDDLNEYYLNGTKKRTVNSNLNANGNGDGKGVTIFSNASGQYYAITDDADNMVYIYAKNVSSPAPPTSSCTCPSANTNWIIAMTDYCNITSACNIGTGNLSFTGAGYCNVSNTITTNKLSNMNLTNGATIYLYKTGGIINLV